MSLMLGGIRKPPPLVLSHTRKGGSPGTKNMIAQRQPNKWADCLFDVFFVGHDLGGNALPCAPSGEWMVVASSCNHTC